MVIFDLREEARLVSFLYLVGGGAVVFGLLALAQRWLLKRLSETLADAARPLAVFFAIISAIMLWLEYDERQQAEALVAQCMSGACDMTEGPVYDVMPVHQIAAGSRYLMPTWRGHFSVGERHFTHYLPSFSGYSPVNYLRDGDRVRVYSLDNLLILVELVS